MKTEPFSQTELDAIKNARSDHKAMSQRGLAAKLYSDRQASNTYGWILYPRTEKSIYAAIRRHDDSIAGVKRTYGKKSTKKNLSTV